MDNDSKKKYRVVYHRTNCIEVLSCVAVYPERWKLNEADRKADLAGGIIDSEQQGVWVLDFTEEEFEKFEESALVCPAKVISIFNLETGKKIV